MEMKTITAKDGSKYSYTTLDYSVANPLGVIKAMLTEYVLYEENNVGVIIGKLYKTSEGNWYDTLTIDGINTWLSANLKMAIDETEKNNQL